jgi:hypothetical protein
MDATKSNRPDGREETTALAALRDATRALRLHLNSLPVDFSEVTTPDRFLAGLAFASACQRFEAAESMIGSGFGGTVLGSLCRSVFFDGLRWLWVSADPETRRRALLGDLVAERNRMCKTLVPPESSCGNLQRWLQPIPPISDLTGESMTWLDATTTSPAVPLTRRLLRPGRRNCWTWPGCAALSTCWRTPGTGTSSVCRAR